MSTIVSQSDLLKEEYEQAFSTDSDDELLTRSQMETRWAQLFPTVLPVAVNLNEDFPEYQWKTRKDGDGDLSETMEKVDSFGFIVPFVPNVSQFLNIKVVKKKLS